MVVLRNPAVLRSVPLGTTVLETDFDCKIQSSAICACLSAADNRSDHKSPYFEIVSASTILGVPQ